MVARRSLVSSWSLPQHFCRNFSDSHKKYLLFGPQYIGNFLSGVGASRKLMLSRLQNAVGFGCQTVSRRCSKYASSGQSSLYFDTHLMVTELHKCGLTLEQSEVITSAIAGVVNSAVGNVKGNAVSRVEQEQLEVRLKSLIEKVRNDMIILEKTEFVRMKDECGKLKSEVASLKFLLQEEVVKLKSGQALDTSLERSRVKEEFQFRDQKIKDNNNRIDTEIARVETKIEAQKLDLLKYLVGSVLSLCTIMLAFWRFFKM